MAKVFSVVRNVRIINVKGTSRSVGAMKGLEQSPILGIKLKDCEIIAERGFSIEHGYQCRSGRSAHKGSDRGGDCEDECKIAEFP
ncbi:hypothetical protein [Desertivirga brevis]|uniref:hypothetical protein n=1 Tax=Desertivirga brevis TaxID=2810310 RepID=UPI001A9616C6|nr:hypothetical protein [Pedobacter sp. SYSU D00873]